MVRDADKLIMGQELRVITPHAIEGVLRQPPDRWMSNARLTHYQGLLLNPLRITFLPPTSLNPASLLPNPDLDAPPHECTEILAQVHGVREDLQDRPLPDTELIWFTDGSSYVHQGQRYAGAAVTSETEVIWAEPLPPRTSAQRAELIALTQALNLGAEKKLTVYTDSRYAFATAHIHGAIYRERGLLTAEGKEIKNKQEILALLTALWKPKKLAIVHCPGHQKPTTPIARGNFLADQTARSIAKAPGQLLMLQLPDPGPRDLPCFPDYTERDCEWMDTLPLKQVQNGWWTDVNDQTILPEKLRWQVLEHIHRTTHLGARRMIDLIRHAKFRIRHIAELASDVTTNCKACQLNNACPQTQTTARIRCRGTRPGVYWEIDFTEIKPGKYSLTENSPGNLAQTTRTVRSRTSADAPSIPAGRLGPSQAPLARNSSTQVERTTASTPDYSHRSQGRRHCFVDPLHTRQTSGPNIRPSRAIWSTGYMDCRQS
ncbi:uncharacterized protein [Chlorocebus sabaeus]|uniref:uncharacterized protein isoform X1 n=1 Tax=Chlorocebus sabaeus TaxID=60711 RepID=UPI003BF9CF04